MTLIKVIIAGFAHFWCYFKRRDGGKSANWSQVVRPILRGGAGLLHSARRVRNERSA